MATRREYIVSSALIALTALSGLVLSSPLSSAKTSGAVNLSVDVPSLCSLTVYPDHHSVTIEHNHTGTIGTSTIKSICNDPSGLDVYAVGFSDDTDGNTDLIATVNNNTYTIPTRATASGTPPSSEWNMTLTAVSGDYAPTIVTGFDSAHAVPDQYTRVAYRETMTDMGDNATGAQFTATFNAYIDGSQATGSYTGKVKFLLVHPSNSPNPVSLLYYNANGGTRAPARQTGTPGTEPGTYDFTISSSIPKKYESVFLGWSEDPEATTATYQPSQNITTNKPLTLYAVWRQGSVTDLDTGSTVNQKLKRLAGNNSATYDTQDTAITAIIRSDTLPSGFTATEDNTISTSTSTIPVYAWFNNGIIYYYSEADIVYLNPNSSYMFEEMRNLSDGSGISSLDASKAKYMYSMFNYAGYNATTFSIDLSEWDTPQAIDMGNMFFDAGYSATSWSIGNVSNWNTSRVTSTRNMFAYAGYNATTFSLNLSEWDMSKVENMNYMFNYAGRNATTFSLDLSSWDAANVTSMNSMFSSAGYNATTFSLNLSDWNIASVEDMGSMFSSAGRKATTWSISGLSDWDTSSMTNMSHMFYYAGENATTFSFDLSGWNTSHVESLYETFTYAGYSATTWSIGNLSNWNTSNVTSMHQMFLRAANAATTLSLNLSGWNTSKVTDMVGIFRYFGYNSTTFSIDLSGWKTYSATDMTNMFSDAGYKATTWSITVPQTNGSGISNTTSRLYGQTTSIYGEPRSGRAFTLAQ